MTQARAPYYKQNRLKKLRAFCQTAKLGSVTKAAEKLFASQPTISLQIQALEREVPGAARRIQRVGQVRDAAAAALGAILLGGATWYFTPLLDRWKRRWRATPRPVAAAPDGSRGSTARGAEGPSPRAGE